MGSTVEYGIRGSEWYRWEPHIHAPGTVLADRYTEQDAWEQYLQALEAATPPLKAIGITDYCVTRSYERVKSEKANGRLRGCDLLFPNIELRLDTGTVKGNFVNIHLLVSPEERDHVAELNRFLGQLSLQAHGDRFTCTPSDLMRLGRRADPKKTVDDDALEHGCIQFKVSRENLLRAYGEMRWAQNNIVIAVAGNADGTSGVRDGADQTLREEIEAGAHVVFASNIKQREFWLGLGAASVNDLRQRYGGPKPCIWGSDAHELARVAKPDEDRHCWIKGTPAFDALRQAVIDPDRAFVGPAPPPSWAAASQIVDEVRLENAPWAQTPVIKLNPGLVAIIGARGSGKTALADIIAAGCDAYKPSAARPSFLARAHEHLVGARVSLSWQNGGHPTVTPLDSPVNAAPEAYERARYLSQQFVEELCSIEGMPALINEIERVIFDAHPSIERDGAVDFAELLDFRAGGYREERRREETALASLSDQIGIELEKARQVATLKVQKVEKEKLLARYQEDRKALLPKGENKHTEHLQVMTSAAEKVRGYIRNFANQQLSLTNLQGEITDLRQNRAPQALRTLKDQHQIIRFDAPAWDAFLLKYSGDVDTTLSTKAADIARRSREWKGDKPTTPGKNGAYLADGADPERAPLAVLEAEIERLQKLVAVDQETVRKLQAATQRIAEETVALERHNEKLVDCEGASTRVQALTGERQNGYVRVFDDIVNEERVLNDLYVPLLKRLQAGGGTLAKLSFVVRRVADVGTWADHGEKGLFDLRGGPFRGIGSLEKIAEEMLAGAWETGDPQTVSAAMSAFLEKYQTALLDNAPYPRSDAANYRPWARRFAQWLYSTDHITIEYGIRYDGLDIRKLSPGTRGIVLVLLYLALDDADDRPLIIDQPEENLDPKSIYDELVPLFQMAKKKRQVIIVTHNANLVVNTDADQIIAAEVGAQSSAGLPPITYRSGGMEEASTRQIVRDILQGGEQAFLDRARRLHIPLQR